MEIVGGLALRARMTRVVTVDWARDVEWGPSGCLQHDTFEAPADAAAVSLS